MASMLTVLAAVLAAAALDLLQDLDPEADAVAAAAAEVDPTSGAVVWAPAVLQLRAVPTALQLDLECAGSTIGTGTVGVEWHPATHWQPARAGRSCIHGW